MTTPQTQFDSPWKTILERYFADFLMFFMPEAHREIDWARGYMFLDKELQQVARDAQLGRRLADKLVQVHLHDGDDAWVLIHVEVQSQDETGFAERMFVYHYRIFDLYQRRVASLAVLGDDNVSWRPHQFDSALWGSTVRFTFPIAKLLDYRAHAAELEHNSNPFATVVLAHLAAQDTRHDDQERARVKFALARQLYQRGYNRQAILDLYHFVDWILALPEDLERQVWQRIKAYEEETQMSYISTAERLGREEGIQVGRAEGRAEGRAGGLIDGIAAVLHVKFGAAAQPILAEIRQITNADILENLLTQSTAAATLDEVRRVYAPPAPDDE